MSGYITKLDAKHAAKQARKITGNDIKTCIKSTNELTMQDIKQISTKCRNFQYNGIAVACQGGWHPISLSNSIQIILKYFPNDPKSMSMALDMLLSLSSYHLLPINFDEFSDNLHKEFMNGYKQTVTIYNILTSPKMNNYIFDSAIRIHSVYILLYYGQCWCLNHKALKGILSVSYCLSKYIEKHHAVSFNYIESKIYLQDSSDDPILFTSAKGAFSSAYCNAIGGYMEQMQLIEFQAHDYDEINFKTFIIKNRILKKLNIAWNFIQRELTHIYQERQIALKQDPQNNFGSFYVRLFLPDLVSSIIANICRVYCILKNDGYGMNRFIKDMNDKIKLLPFNDTYKDFKYIHDQIAIHIQKLIENSWIIMNFKLMPQKQIDESLKYGAQTKYICNTFTSKKKIRFLKNFLRGIKCGYCSVRNKKLKICVKCKKQRYCSKKCQKRQWVQHKHVCIKA